MSYKVHLPETRPPMLFFVPFELGVMLICSATMFASVFKLYGAALSVFPIWGACAALVSRDYNGVRVFTLKMYQTRQIAQGRLWGGKTINHAPTNRPGFRGIA